MFDFLSGSQEVFEDAFAKVYGRFSKPILRYVRTRIPDPHVAEEIMQEVFLKAFRFRSSYQDRYALSTWLWTIARNTVADHLRALKNNGQVDDSEQAADEIPCNRPTAEQLTIRKAESKDQRRRYIRMLKPLTRMQKRVLWMRIIHQLSYEEISRKLGVSLSAVKNLAYRARISLEQSLGGPLPALA